MRWASGMFLASQSYNYVIFYLLQGCFKKRKDGKCLHKVEPQPLVKESGLFLELHQRHSSVCSLCPLWILPWEFSSLFGAKQRRKHTHCRCSSGVVKRRMSWDCRGNSHCPFPSSPSWTLLHHLDKIQVLQWGWSLMELIVGALDWKSGHWTYSLQLKNHRTWKMLLPSPSSFPYKMRGSKMN